MTELETSVTTVPKTAIPNRLMTTKTSLETLARKVKGKVVLNILKNVFVGEDKDKDGFIGKVNL